MKATGKSESVEAYLRQALQLLIDGQLGDATMTLSLAYIEAEKLPTAEKLRTRARIALMAAEAEHEYLKQAAAVVKNKRAL